MKTTERKSLISVVFVVIAVAGAFAQVSSPGSASSTKAPSAARTPAQCSATRLDRCLLDVAKDQAGIWTSPFRMQKVDALWLLPFAAATGTSIYYDRQAMEHFGTSDTQLNFGRNVSKISAPYVTFGAAGGLYFLGAASHNERLRETGLLGAEAIVDTTILTEALKFATNRDRPYQGNGNGDFWPHGTKAINTDASMPSEHAAAAWAFARVLSMEYPDRPWLKLLAYGSALTVSTARVMARDHFPSDVLVGSTFGFLTGGYVMRHHGSDYKDTFTYSVTPVIGGPNRTRGLTLTITPSSDFDLCRAFQMRGARFLTKIDRRCTAETP